ncbi:hypothetical protein AABB24_020311 [Solanum stoloniferum]|uniref:Transmembrane protein n=1 Tax=Solanum stoloniferum TaxID=62892 RepID=A0ABD2T7G4_9SOLN
MKGGQIPPRKEDKNLHLEIKARTRGSFLIRRLLPEACIFLHGLGDSMQLCRPFWRIHPWQLIVGLVLLILLRRLRALMPKSRLIHRALMPRQMKRLCRHDPLFTSLSVLLYFTFGYFCLHLRTNILFVVG